MDKAYMRPYGSDKPWTEVGTVVGFDPGDLLQTPEKSLSLSGQSVTATWTLPKISTLDMRAFLRLFDIPSPSLIHNGKKRRKS